MHQMNGSELLLNPLSNDRGGSKGILCASHTAFGVVYQKQNILALFLQWYQGFSSNVKNGVVTYYAS